MLILRSNVWKQTIGRERERADQMHTSCVGKLESADQYFEGTDPVSRGRTDEHFALREQSVRSQIAEKEEEKNAILEEKKAFDAAYEKMRLQMEEAAQADFQNMQQQMDAYNETIDERSKRRSLMLLTERCNDQIQDADAMTRCLNRSISAKHS